MSFTHFPGYGRSLFSASFSSSTGGTLCSQARPRNFISPVGECGYRISFQVDMLETPQLQGSLLGHNHANQNLKLPQLTFFDIQKQQPNSTQHDRDSDPPDFQEGAQTSF